jgi:hypothetical protein
MHVHVNAGSSQTLALSAHAKAPICTSLILGPHGQYCTLLRNAAYCHAKPPVIDHLIRHAALRAHGDAPVSPAVDAPNCLMCQV